MEYGLAQTEKGHPLAILADSNSPEMACLQGQTISASKPDLTLTPLNENLETNWDSAVQTKLWPAPTMKEFLVAMRTKNYPAVHHSDEFQSAYRVIRREYFPHQDIGG